MMGYLFYDSVQKTVLDVPGGPLAKNPPASGGDTGLIPGLGRCLGATKSRCHNYWAQTPQPLMLEHPRAHAPQQEKPLQREAYTPQERGAPAGPKKARIQKRGPSAAKTKL